MPFSPLIGISFLFHLVFALADVAFCSWKRYETKRKMQLMPTHLPVGTFKMAGIPDTRPFAPSDFSGTPGTIFSFLPERAFSDLRSE